MIFLNNISESITNKHWDYFKASSGYSNLLKLSKDTSIPTAERNYFLRLSNESILQSIIVGKPKQLRQEVHYFQTKITTQIPLLTLYQTFLSFLNWKEDIYPQINRQAEKNTSSDAVAKTRKELYKEFLDLINKTGDSNLKTTFKKDKTTIKNLKTMYDGLKDFFNTKVGQFYSRVFSVFDYNDFIKESKSWYAYDLTRELGINVCPYCNRNYIHTSINEHGRTRAELDHFYPKSKYPFLSISLYNLVPSCHVCNSNLKKAKDFYSERHLHPYENNNINDFRFEIMYRQDSFDGLVPNDEEFDIVITPLTEDDEIKALIKNSDETFQIAKLHNYHKDIAQELIVRSIYYNKTKIEELKDFLGEEAGIDDDFLKRVITGNYAEIGNFIKRPLAKYSYDILSKTDLLKDLEP